MRKSYRFSGATLIAIFSMLVSYAQTVTLTGTVLNTASKEPVPAVSVIVKGSSGGTFTNENGVFKVNVDKLPAVLIFSSVGYATQEVNVTSATQVIQVQFEPGSSLGQEVVVAASRDKQVFIEVKCVMFTVSVRSIL